MYQLTRTEAVFRLSDGALIPPDAGNRDWLAYLAWRAAGNQPEPAPSGPPPRIIVSRLRLKLELRDRALLEIVEDAVNAVGGDALFYWRELNEFESDHPLVALIGQAVGLTPTEVRALFVAARDRQA